MSSIKNESDAIEVIGKFANGGEGFEKKVVERLATYFKSKLFTSPVTGAAQGVVNNYWVGFFVPTPIAGLAPEKPGSIEFFTGEKFKESRREIGSAFVVPTLRVDVAAPALVPRTLDFKNPADGPKVVITSQLKGCTFAIGIADDKYVMSHAWPETGVTGVELAQAIRGRAQKFEGTTTTSTFLIHPGNTIDGKSGFGYGDTLQQYKANVIGFVVKHTPLLGLAKSKATYSLSFIVVVIKGQTSIEKVVVVSFKDSEWKVEEIKK
jgi:hypothetical protein